MSEDAGQEGDLEWRNGWLLRAFVMILALVFGGFVTLGFWFEEDMKVEAICLALALTGVVYIWYFRPKLVATAEGVEIVNPLTRYRLGWVEVKSVKPGYSGLTFETEAGVRICWAVQEGNVPAWFKMDTRSKRVIACLRHRGWIN